jgi:hypothetical protein
MIPIDRVLMGVEGPSGDDPAYSAYVNDATPEARVPEIFRRYVAAATEDFVTRTEAMVDLGDVLEAIAWNALEDEGALDRWTATDGVEVHMIQTADRRLECECALWMLDPESWAVPLHATFELSEDLNSVTSYEVKIADTSREARQARSGRRDPQQWATVVSTATSRLRPA